jgi:hypothetical protein
LILCCHSGATECPSLVDATSVCFACGKPATRKTQSGFVCGSDRKFGCLTVSKNRAASGIQTRKNTPNYEQKRLQKFEDTCLKKYGVRNPTQSEELLVKREKTFLETTGKTSTQVLIESKVRYCQKRGVSNVFQLSEVRDKSSKTCMRRYGVPHAMQSQIIKDRARQVNLERYGVPYSSSLDEVKKKREETCLEKYGVTNAMFNKDIESKQRATRFKVKPLVLPSGRTIRYQGYEDRALTRYLLDNSEDQFMFNGELTFWYTNANGRKGRYTPDFALRDKRVIVEVKSVYTFTLDPNLFLKMKAVESEGWNPVVEVWSENSLLQSLTLADLEEVSS